MPLSVFARRCSAEPRSVAALRREVDAWLAGLDWPDAEREDVGLAISEACTNAVEHAYPPGAAGEVAVFGRLHANGQLRHVAALVRDWGHWRRPPADPGYRGHGITVMRECLHRLTIERSRRGTFVAMTSCPVPNLASASAAIRHRPTRRRSGSDLAHTAITVGPGDRADEEGRQAAIRRCTAALRTESAAHAAAAASARQRSQSIVATSARLTAELRRIWAGRRRDAA